MITVTYSINGETHTVRVLENTLEAGEDFNASRIGTSDPYETTLEWLGLDTETHMNSQQLKDAAAFAEIVRIWDDETHSYLWDTTVEYADCLGLLALVFPSLLSLPGILPEIWMDLNNFYPSIDFDYPTLDGEDL